MAPFELGPQRIEVRRDPVPHVVIDDVFGADAAAAMLSHVQALEPAFAPAGIGRDGELATMRRNLTCGVDAHFFEPDDEALGFEDRIARRAERSILLASIDGLLMSGELREVFDGAPHPLCKLSDVNRWETQVSRYGAEGDAYDWHLDRIGNDDRVLSIAYYLFEEPRLFEGGELELTDALVRRGELVSNGQVARVEPRHDRAVLFPSRAVHRVLATRAPDRFGAGRFSVNVFCGIAPGSPPGRVY
ncbi:MAG: 2OG-Fe(II) oxygenase [Sandaracinaceae bacterium]|nr:2OG-Fe(II) oxygenase [Sandaracinaceae bacterium]